MSIILEIKVKTCSNDSKISMNKSNQICINLKSKPEKNKANMELIRLLAKKLAINICDISIMTGRTSKIKRIKIDNKLNNLTKEEILKKLNSLE